MQEQNQDSGIYLISISTSEDARSIFTHEFPVTSNFEQRKKIIDLKDLLTSFTIAIGSGKDHQRDELTGFAAGNSKILVEWCASLVGIFFVASDWSLEKEAYARDRMQYALREIELVYQEEIDEWRRGGGELSIFKGISAILGRFFSEYSLVQVEPIVSKEFLQNPYQYFLKPIEESQAFLPLHLQSQSYRNFLEHEELAGETAYSIICTLEEGISPVHLVLKSTLTPPEKIAALLAHLTLRRAFNLLRLPVQDADIFFDKLNAFFAKMNQRENLGPPANAFYTSQMGDCPFFVWTENKDCLTKEGERSGCHGKVFRNGVCCELFLERLQNENI
ncbi:MAG: hypothetical protein ACE5R6_20675 [Candidatus Heimdallarchaeota archaeon]